MGKSTHEFRDPIHVFIQMDTWMRSLVDSREVQRLRFIHQLAMSYLVYPGTTHNRFEHSLGVMELSGRVFDTLCRPENLMHDKSLFEVVDKFAMDQGRTERIEYWRRILRVAALTHDIGHFPFSHAAEDLAPEGVDHEVMTFYHLRSDAMRPYWRLEASILDSEVIAGIAVGGKALADMKANGLIESGEILPN